MLASRPQKKARFRAAYLLLLIEAEATFKPRAPQVDRELLVLKVASREELPKKHHQEIEEACTNEASMPSCQTPFHANSTRGASPLWCMDSREAMTKASSADWNAQ